MQARLSLHLSKCHFVGNHLSQLKSFCPLVAVAIHVVLCPQFFIILNSEISLQSVSAAQQFPTTLLWSIQLFFSSGNSRPTSPNLEKVQLSILSVSVMSKAQQVNVVGRF